MGKYLSEVKLLDYLHRLTPSESDQKLSRENSEKAQLLEKIITACRLGEFDDTISQTVEVRATKREEV